MTRNNQVARRPVDKLKAIINQDSVKEQFQNALGKHRDLFVASLIDVYSDGLQKYDASLVIQEALKAAVLKLPISKSLGFAYIVPYKGKPQFQIGYKGMIQLAMRSGQLKILNAGPVYEGEYQSFNKLTGIVDLDGKKTSEVVVGYFSYMELINGFQKAEYWTKEQVTEHAKAKSPSYKHRSSAWHTDFDAMATKTVLRSMLGKYAPMSVDFIAALTYDEPENIITSAEQKDITPPPPKRKKKANPANTEPHARTELPKKKTDKKDSPSVTKLKALWKDPTFDAAIQGLMKEDENFTKRQYKEITANKFEDAAAVIVRRIEAWEPPRDTKDEPSEVPDKLSVEKLTAMLDDPQNETAIKKAKAADLFTQKDIDDVMLKGDTKAAAGIIDAISSVSNAGSFNGQTTE